MLGAARRAERPLQRLAKPANRVKAIPPGPVRCHGPATSLHGADDWMMRRRRLFVPARPARAGSFPEARPESSGCRACVRWRDRGEGRSGGREVRLAHARDLGSGGEGADGDVVHDAATVRTFRLGLDHRCSLVVDLPGIVSRSMLPPTIPAADARRDTHGGRSMPSARSVRGSGGGVPARIGLMAAAVDGGFAGITFYVPRKVRNAHLLGRGFAGNSTRRINST